MDIFAMRIRLSQADKAFLKTTDTCYERDNAGFVTSVCLGRKADEGIFRLGPLDHLKSLDIFQDCDLSDAGLKQLAKAYELQEIKLSPCTTLRITPDGFRYFEKLPKLTHFRTAYQGDLDAAMLHIGQIKSLKELSLAHSRLKGHGLVHLSGLTKLLDLQIMACDIGDEGLENINLLPQLTSLSVSHTNVGDAGLSTLTALHQLERLCLEMTRITDRSTDVLITFKNLEFLSLSGLAISNVTIDRIVQLEKLETLFLDGSTVDDEGAVRLTALRNLDYLGLTGTRVTRRGIHALRCALPNCDIDHESIPVTD